MIEEEPEYYVFTGERVPEHVTHVLIDKALNFVPARSFEGHPNIEEVICHDGVAKIEQYAFNKCPRLRRVIMPGVKIIEQMAFNRCEALTYIECVKLERIGAVAFQLCKSLNSIDLPSIKILEDAAFFNCTNLTDAKFGKDLVSFGGGSFEECTSLERITLPLKNGMLTYCDTFRGCEKLKQVDLVGRVHETIAAFLLEDWKDDMNGEIDSINRILPNKPSGDLFEVGGKVEAIRTWIRSFLLKYTHYKAEHRRYLNEAAATLQSSLPNDILFRNVLALLELPSYTLEGQD